MLRTFRKLMRPGCRVPARVVAKAPRVVILASGVGQRWEAIEHKQLVNVHGQPLLLRTIEQIQQRWDTRPAVMTHHVAIAEMVEAVADVVELPASERRWTVETALSSREHWGEPTLLLAGDVYWTDQAMDLACGLNRGGPVRFLTTQCAAGQDILGIWFRRRHRNKIAKALHHARQHALIRGGGGKLWQAYRSLCGYPLTRHWLDAVHAIPIDDETTDFDSLLDYQAFLQKAKQRAA